ncbi:hypothetical protein N9N28_15575 [Rubripirellula amarantea]|nr:hypothetical protein [Rubripirellula amarantea]
MCIFSQSVEDVSDTSIFARLENGHQFLVYRMSYAAANELAMVLPLPVPTATAEEAVRFISLQQYPTFFDDMLSGFPTRSATLSLGRGAPVAAGILSVHDVGDFDASFVPHIHDFARLDPRFRLDDELWNKLPEYAEYGFAVFKLKPTKQAKSVHPMAFRFPTRLDDAIYFPTLHIHDGDLPQNAEFDHMLYCQFGQTDENDTSNWRQSFDVASKFMDIPRSAGIVDGDLHCSCMGMNGTLKNTDTIVG